MRGLLAERAFNLLTAKSTKVGQTNRRIRSDVLCHTCCLAHGVVEVVPEDARGTGLLAELTRSTGKHEFSVVEIFFGIEHIGTRIFSEHKLGYVTWVGLTIHDRTGK